MYFNSIEEAYEWLEPDAGYADLSTYANDYPEQFDEWLTWVAAGELLDGNGRDL